MEAYSNPVVHGDDQIKALEWLKKHHEPLWAETGAASFHIEGYTAELYLRDPKRLVVCFDSRAEQYEDSRIRPAWALDFLRKQGCSALHIKPDQSCWYRRPQLAVFFEKARDSGIFAAFESVMTYGGSMGGFGALSFAGLSNAKICLTYNPQVNLGPSVRDWETRFEEALLQDWTSPLCDIDRQVANVETLVSVIDPYCLVDRKQLDLIETTRLMRLHLPFVRHRIPSHLLALGVLKDLFQKTADGSVEPEWFAHAVRRRRYLKRYRNEMLRRSQHRPARHQRLMDLLPSEGLRGKG